MVALVPYRRRQVEQQATLGVRAAGPSAGAFLRPVASAAQQAAQTAKRLEDERERERLKRKAEEERAAARRSGFARQLAKAALLADAERESQRRRQQADPGAPGFAAGMEEWWDEQVEERLGNLPEHMSDEDADHLRAELSIARIGAITAAEAVENAERQRWEGQQFDAGLEDFATMVYLNPAGLEGAINDVDGFLDDIGASPGERAEYRAQAQERLALEAAKGLIESNPDAALSALKSDSGPIGANISQNSRATLFNSAQAEIKRREAEAKRAYNERLSLVRDDARFAVSALDSGRTPAGLDRIRAMASGTPYEAEIDAAIARSADVAEFARLPIDEQIARYNELDAREVTPSSLARLQAYGGALKAKQSAAENGAILEHAAGLGANVAPLDHSDPSSWALRIATSESLAPSYGGRDVPILTGADRQALAAQLEQASESENAAWLAGLSVELGPERFDKVAEALGGVGFGPEYRVAADRLRRNPYATDEATAIIAASRVDVKELGLDDDTIKAVRADSNALFDSGVGAVFRAQAAIRGDGPEALQAMSRYRDMMAHVALTQAGQGVDGGWFGEKPQDKAYAMLFSGYQPLDDGHAKIVVDSTVANPDDVLDGLAQLRARAPELLAELRPAFPDEFAFEEFVNDAASSFVWLNHGSSGFALYDPQTGRPVALPDGRAWVVTAEEAAQAASGERSFDDISGGGP